MTAKYTRIVPPAMIVARSLAGARTGVKIAGEMLRRDSNATCPIDTGTLRNSARVTATGSNATQARSTVSYNTPYAVVVHEKVGLTFQGPGRHKWLQLTAMEQQAKYAQTIADAIKRSTS